MPRNRKIAMLASAVALVAARPALGCEDGQVLKPGDSCEVAIRWGHDHWVAGDFADDAEHRIEFTHVSGDCSVSLFGPAEGLLAPGADPVSHALGGEYHLFSRALAIAKGTCTYRVAVR